MGFIPLLLLTIEHGFEKLRYVNSCFWKQKVVTL